MPDILRPSCNSCPRSLSSIFGTPWVTRVILRHTLVTSKVFWRKDTCWSGFRELEWIIQYRISDRRAFEPKTRLVTCISRSHFGFVPVRREQSFSPMVMRERLNISPGTPLISSQMGEVQGGTPTWAASQVMDSWFGVELFWAKVMFRTPQLLFPRSFEICRWL